ncbi:hypothetical protein [Psychroflexus aestuariivivens]|uniref:hypothetical protein n=1 Tax=Psychroflexus aestuariivivens TaxID=1795040 RepID=UPI000FDAB38C|nr:hypothetical protein [Psychroflexus aestuariivivens]
MIEPSLISSAVMSASSKLVISILSNSGALKTKATMASTNIGFPLAVKFSKNHTFLEGGFG